MKDKRIFKKKDFGRPFFWGGGKCRDCHHFDGESYCYENEEIVSPNYTCSSYC